MKTPIRNLTFLAALSAAPLIAQVQVPSLMNYQGQLANAAGTPLPTADYTLTFRIYDAAQGGALIWGPQIFDGTPGPGHGPKIPVVQGYFNTTLGPTDANSTPRSLADAFGPGATRYVEIQVGTNAPVAPRQQLMSAPFAVAAGKAAAADTARKMDVLDGNGVPVPGQSFGWAALFNNGRPDTGKMSGDKLTDASVTAAKIAPGAVGGAQIQPGAVTTSAIADGSITQVDLSNALQTDSLIPAGVVVAFSGTVAPPGWLMCDGRLFDKATYPRLAAVLNTPSGAAFGGDSTKFNVPDLRGRFLRGADDPDGAGANFAEAGRDPDRQPSTNNGADGKRYVMAPGGNSGNSIGSLQSDAIRAHDHGPGNYTTNSTGEHVHTSPAGDNGYLFTGGAGANVRRDGNAFGGGAMQPAGAHTHIIEAGRSGVTGGFETRPPNAYINYIIKY